MKKSVVKLLIVAILCSQSICLAEDTFQGHAIKEDEQQEQSELFKGKVETLDKHDVIKMTVSQVIDGSYSFEGDEFFAKVTSDVNGEGGVIIPKGTVGLAMSLYRKGKDVLIAPGDEIRVKVSSSMSLPVYKDSALKQDEISFPGLTVRIANILYEKDLFGVLNTITLSMSVSNMSTT